MGVEKKAQSIIDHFFDIGARVGKKDFDYIYSVLVEEYSQGFADGERRTKPKPKTTKLITTDPIDRELSLLLVKEIEIQLPTFKTPNMDVWATHINKMRILDNRTPQQIEFIIKWCQNDSFWQGNILSTKKLREKFDTLTAQAKRNQVNVVDISDL